MNYFLDTEFLEGEQTIRQWGMKTDTWLRIFGIFFLLLSFGLYWYFVNTILLIVIVFVCFNVAAFLISLSIPKTPPTIDLISIGIVSEDARELYEISNEFNLKEAWNRYDLKIEVMSGDMRNKYPEGKKTKVYWIRENVLLPIYYELCLKENSPSVTEYGNYNNFIGAIQSSNNYRYVYKNLKRLISKYGKSNKEIAKSILNFVCPKDNLFDGNMGYYDREYYLKNINIPSFYGYYADYDWVVFCWLFGKMNNLPEGFPKYCIDLKQMLDHKAMAYFEGVNPGGENFYERLDTIKSLPKYPQQQNEHNALADALWNLQLYNFIQNL